jgi:hypothetical protein
MQFLTVDAFEVIHNSIQLTASQNIKLIRVGHHMSFSVKGKVVPVFN